MNILTPYFYLRNRVRDLLAHFYTYRERKRADTVGTDLSVNGPTTLSPYTKLGDNVNINGMEVRGEGRLTIGDNFHSGPRCVILTHNHNFDDGESIPYDDTYIRRPVTIEDNVWFGIGVYVVPGVTIEEGAIIQAGSVVTHDIPKCAIAGGHPAEVFAYRDIDRYERLKAEEEFY